MSITITSAASEEVKKIKATQNLGEETFLRIGILGGGCSGMQYALNFDTVFDNSNDTQYEWDGVKLATQKKFDPHFDGTTIDFLDNSSGRGFSIDNPNFPKASGCSCCGH
ncbi:MAG: iron-sulfur cluster assembly accessory protein [Planctomycetaceae bacterium]|jgi:iron-sulfur cluster assembly protein|nr:iron-sulfur cluster assembly accessory protein [Planctomycetaceae bacterium]